MRAFAGSLFLRLALLVVVTVLATQVFTLWLSVRQKHALLADQLYAQVIDTLADLVDGDRARAYNDLLRPAGN